MNSESSSSNTESKSNSSINEKHDFSFLLEEPAVYRFEGKKNKVVKKKRKYDKAKAAETRTRNKRLRNAGKNIPPNYKRKTKRPYRQTGKYRGARVMQGGKVRKFKKSALQHLNSVHSKFMSTEGQPLTFHGKKNKLSK